MRPPHIGLPMTVAIHHGREMWALSPTYARAVRDAGGLPLPIPLLDADDDWDHLYASLDGLLLCGGGDVAPQRYGARRTGLSMDIVPARDALELHLTRRALDDGLPLLAICRGIQVLNVAAGGTLIQDIDTERPGALPHRTAPTLPRDHIAHTVRLAPQGLLARLRTTGQPEADATKDVPVNSTHHQAIDRLGAGLRVTAVAADGIIEAIEGADPGRTLLGVQWHPEELQNGVDPLHRALFAHLVRCAAGIWEE